MCSHNILIHQRYFSLGDNLEWGTRMHIKLWARSWLNRVLNTWLMAFLQFNTIRCTKRTTIISVRKSVIPLSIRGKEASTSAAVQQQSTVFILILIIMDYCLLQFDALEFFLGVRLHRGLYLTLIFSM